MRRTEQNALALVFLCAVFGASAAVTCGNGIQEEGKQCEDGNLYLRLPKRRLRVFASSCKKIPRH
jgi:hypothetical protein